MSTVAVRSVALPPPIPGLNRRIRQPKKNIPQTKADRDQILGWVRAYAEDPLVHDRITPRLARFILDAGRQVVALRNGRFQDGPTATGTTGIRAHC